MTSSPMGPGPPGHEDELGFESLAIHAGQPPDPSTGAVVTPIFQTSTFAQSAVGQHLGYEYSRSGNPTRHALEVCLAALEGAEHGLAFASGLAAEDALLRQLRPGDHLVMPDDAYGGTYRLVAQVHARAGINFTPVATYDLDALEQAFTESTRMVWVESPSNPLLHVTDLAAVAQLAHHHGALLVVDNTFATPYLQRPLALGADAVVHSTTKYLGGHSDVVGGFVATSDGDLAERLAFVQNAAGAVPGPFDCFLVLRGIKTLPVRLDRHCTNAEAVVALLSDHPAVDHVLYPGLPSHPGHETAAGQMRRFGGMVSFTLRGGERAALEVASSTRLFTLAESLGAVESLVEHPHRMTHASAVGSPLAVDPALLRLSVGLEAAEDLLRDLRRALDPLS
ncbi:MAG TPA: cystathionine gamma-synthase [Acidimicrobiales bacterium]|nr:cystathionine gamma-synthase [Acidimicrobiales bacterium]